MDDTEFLSNRGVKKRLPIDNTMLDDIKKMNVGKYFQQFYKPYYAVYFNIRALALGQDEKLFQDKIYRGNDVVVIDTTGTSSGKILSRLKMAKKEDYTTTIIYLELDPELCITRDEWRRKHQGRGVGDDVIYSYASKIDGVYAQYMQEGKNGTLIDRIMHFEWVPKGDSPIYGSWRKLSDHRFSLRKKVDARKK